MAKFVFSKILLSKPEAEWRTSITQFKKLFSLKLSRNFIEQEGLDGKIIEFLADPAKKAIGFRVIPTLLSGSKLGRGSTLRLIKNKKFGCILTISELLRSTGVPMKPYLKLPLKQYEDSSYGDVWYVKLSNVED